MVNRWFLSNGKMAYACDLATEGKFHVFGEYVQPGTGDVYMLQTSYGVGGWRIYSSTETAPNMLPYNWFTERDYHLDECLFMFRDEHPYRVYIGPNMEEGYHSLCVWTDTQLGSKALLGTYSDYAALQTILRKDRSPLQISFVAVESLSVATEDTASIAVNLEEIDASTDFRFCLGRFRDANAFALNQKTSVTRGYTTDSVVSNGKTFDNVVTVVEGVDSGMSLSWMNQSDSESIWFSIGAGSVRDAEIVKDASEVEEPTLTSPWKALQAAIASAPTNGAVKRLQLVSPGKMSSGLYTAVYTDENGKIVAESDDTFLNVLSGQNIVLDLNGHTIDRNLSVSTEDGYAIKVQGTLTLEDESMDGALCGGNNYASGAEGGGVLVMDSGEFVLKGGQISGNQAYYGGVAVAEGGKFVMQGGKISGNNASYGGGVANNGEFVLSGGGIIENEATIGGGAFNNENGVATMDGGSLYKNTA